MNILKEYLDLQKDEENDRLVIVSTHDPNQRKYGIELYANRKELGNIGFVWDKAVNGYVGSMNRLKDATDLINNINKNIQGKYYPNDKINIITAGLNQLKSWINTMSGDEAKKSKISSQINIYIDDLANEVDESVMSDEIRRFLEFSSKFHNYSFTNRLLIYMQKRNATKVAGKKTWENKFHRKVNDDAQPISIWVPWNWEMMVDDPDYKPEDGVGDDVLDDTVGKKKISGIKFMLGDVYDISETTAVGEEGGIPEEPEWFSTVSADETGQVLIDVLTKIVKGDSIKLTRDAALRGEKGYSAGGHINISADVKDGETLAILVHEYAHELLHRENSKFYSYFKESIKGFENNQMAVKVAKEIQAEGTAYTVLRHFDIPVKHSSTYIALWKGNSAKVKKNHGAIHVATKHIINNIDDIIYSEKEN